MWISIYNHRDPKYDERKGLNQGKFYKSRNSSGLENYRKIRNRVVNMRSKAARQHFRRMCEDKCGDQRSFWRTIKPCINSRKNKSIGHIVLKDNEKIVRDKQHVAEALNEFFTSVGRSENKQEKPTLTHIADKVRKIPSLRLTNTNPTEIREVMKNIKQNKATGYDLIPPRAVRLSADVLC